MFYDVTTLYFESKPQPDDELRQAGFSKDGKTSESQIVLGLLVSEDRYPLSYSIFNGSQYEGRTMIPIIDDFIQRFSLTDFVVVADSGLMSAKNISLLETERITFNEKTFWRGGPNTAKGADYYLNVNKQSAHLLDEIRKAFFTEGDQKKAEMLTEKILSVLAALLQWEILCGNRTEYDRNERL